MLTQSHLAAVQKFSPSLVQPTKQSPTPTAWPSGATPWPLPRWLQDRLSVHADPDQAFRHSGWAALRHRIAMAIWQTDGNDRRIERFSACGRDAWVVQHPKNQHDYRVMSNFCNDRFCVPCARARGALVAENLLTAVGDKPIRMITLTLKTDPTCPLRTSLDRLYFSFAKLRRTAFWQSHVTGGAALLEVAYSARSPRWHPHLHILAHGRFIPQSDLSAAWQQATGNSFIVDIRSIPDTETVVRYVTKYVSKPMHASVHRSHDLLCELIVAVRARRLCLTFGTWRGLQLLQSGPLTDWVYIGTFAEVRKRAADGNCDAQKIINTLNAQRQVSSGQQLDPAFHDS